MKWLLVAVDPGLTRTGVAIFELQSKQLTHASFVSSKITGAGRVAQCLCVVRAVKRYCNASIAASEIVTALAFEWPRVYKGEQQKGDQNDLLPMPGIDVGIAAMFPSVLEEDVHTYEPREWKGGSRSKEQMAPAIWMRLSVEERSRCTRTERGGGLAIGTDKGIDDNMLDAVGIGLAHLGRLERIRVYD